MVENIDCTRKSSNCMVLVIHHIDDIMLKYMSFLRSATHDIMDLMILYDCATGTIDASDYPDYTFLFFDSGKLEGFFQFQKRELPNPLLALIDLSKKKQYEHYLVMEGDVVFTGDFRTFLWTMNQANHDYVHIATDNSKNMLEHWPMDYIHDNPFHNLYFSWSQLFYISHQYLFDLGKFLEENDSFYYEILLPTMAYNKGSSIKQFENFGYSFQVSWGPAEKYERKYLQDKTDNTFYHPIKDLSIVKFHSKIKKRRIPIHSLTQELKKLQVSDSRVG